MLRRLRAQLNYPNVVATLCLFVVLGGGAYAATRLPKNSVGTRQLKKNAVTSPKVKNGSLLAKDFKSGAFPPTVSASATNDPEPNVDLTPTLKPVLSATLTTKARSRIVANAMVESSGTAPGAAIECRLEIGRDGVFARAGNPAYVVFTAGSSDTAIPVLGSAPMQPPGTYTVRLECRDGPADANYESGDLAVLSVPS